MAMWFITLHIVNSTYKLIFQKTSLPSLSQSLFYLGTTVLGKPHQKTLSWFINKQVLCSPKEIAPPLVYFVLLEHGQWREEEGCVPPPLFTSLLPRPVSAPLPADPSLLGCPRGPCMPSVYCPCWTAPSPLPHPPPTSGRGSSPPHPDFYTTITLA